MEKIKKGNNFSILFLIITFIVSFESVVYPALCDRYDKVKLRVPIDTKKTNQRQLQVINSRDLTFGFGTRFGASNDPNQYDPYGNWTVLSHGGITDPQNFSKLMYLYWDISRAKTEVFCCFETSSNNPKDVWRDMGLILDISKGGEVLYADRLRGGNSEGYRLMYPFEKDTVQLSQLIDGLRANRIINKKPLVVVPGAVFSSKEIDVTNADIVGVFLKMELNKKGFLDLLKKNPHSFAVLIAMAIRYKLPILLIPSESGNWVGYEKGCKAFWNFVSKNSRTIFSYMKDIDSESFQNLSAMDVRNAILAQIRPIIVKASISELEIIRPSTATNL